jgi:hypothetical protein
MKILIVMLTLLSYFNASDTLQIPPSGYNLVKKIPYRYGLNAFQLRCAQSNNEMNAPDAPADGNEDRNMLTIKRNSVNMDAETEEKVIQQLQENMPSDLEIRMKLMGLNSFTITGFALAFVIIFLNYTLGYGWAANLLGI